VKLIHIRSEHSTVATFLILLYALICSFIQFRVFVNKTLLNTEGLRSQWRLQVFFRHTFLSAP